MVYCMLKLATLWPPSHSGSSQPIVMDLQVAKMMNGKLGGGGKAANKENIIIQATWNYLSIIFMQKWGELDTSKRAKCSIYV